MLDLMKNDPSTNQS